MIPKFLGNYSSLRILALSFNNLEGEVPKGGVFTNASSISVLGNKNLCGGIFELHLPTCPVLTSKKRQCSSVHAALDAIVAVLGVILCILVYLWLIQRSRRKKSPSPMERSLKVSYSELNRANLEDRYITVSYSKLLEATGGFSAANFLGDGAFGPVFRGFQNQGDTPVAVKVLNRRDKQGALKSVTAECEALRKIRHRNLFKIFSCSSIDDGGREFTALILEYMPNGSLDEWLHPVKQHSGSSLNFSRRLNIAIDVASALEYLHHQIPTPVVHCDIKPRNVLLHEDMTACVSAIGLAKVFLDYGGNSDLTKTIVLSGSVGYVAPEYGMGGKISVKGDVYSFGILLLEMFTGKRPTDQMFEEGESLHKFAKTALLQCVTDDTVLQLEEEEDWLFKFSPGGNGSRSILDKHLASVIEIGDRCSVERARDRPEMGAVTLRLCAIRDSLRRSSFRNY